MVSIPTRGSSRVVGEQQVPPKVVLAKIGLDGHDRGIKVIARALRDAGMEVVYLGMRLTPAQVALAANQEDADVVGISILSGAHLRLIPRLTGALEDQGLLGKTLLLVGGTIPEQDVPSLLALGVDGVFPVGTFSDAMIEFIRANVGLREGGES
jgi:methylmalonyl-CoA mutase C-terminal domain/subunit